MEPGAIQRPWTTYIEKDSPARIGLASRVGRCQRGPVAALAAVWVVRRSARRSDSEKPPDMEKSAEARISSTASKTCGFPSTERVRQIAGAKVR